MITYQAGQVKAIGKLLLPEGKGPFPTIVLFPAWFGRDKNAQDYGEKIVSTFGWAVFLADYYGDGKVAGSKAEAASLMQPLFLDREELRQRVEGAFNAATMQSEVDKNRIGAIGFCFGGLAAIELFKMGLKLKGVAAFHTLLGYQMGDAKAKKLPIAKGITSALLILQGYLDPSVPAESRQVFEKEMEEAGVDWQFHLYGKAMHGFTNPSANEPDSGLLFDPLAAERSFKLMGSFFNELFV